MESELFTISATYENGGEGFATLADVGTNLDQVWDYIKDRFLPGSTVIITNLWSRTTKTFIKE